MKSYLFFFICFLSSSIAQATTFIVTTNANGGAGSLRTAITNANNSVGRDSIVFNLGNSLIARTISLTTALPVVDDTLMIDGTSQPSLPFGNSNAKVIIRAAVANIQGLRLYADYCEVYGLYINGFGNAISFSPIELNIGTRIGAAGKGNVISGSTGGGIVGYDLIGTIIQSNFIGVDTTGLQTEGNQGYGILASSFLTNGIIGGNNPQEGNTICGNALGGIAIQAGDSLQLLGNKIGVTYLGTTISGNGGNGVYIGAVGENEGYLVENNVISGNAQGGLRISSNHSIVRNNFIGTDISGTQNFGNQGYGLSIDRKFLEIKNNVISGNLAAGIDVSVFARHLSILGNKIGSDITGLNELGNANNGIEMSGDSCTIGGINEADRNIIVGNFRGIYLYGNDVKILNNYIGIGSDGSSIIGNTTDGIYISNAENFEIGSTNGGGNVISGNGQDGIYANQGSGVISGNIIGVSADSIPFSVGQNRGIDMRYAASGKIEQNYIEGHTSSGIVLQASSNVEIVGNTIQGNIEHGIDLSICMNITIGVDSMPNFIRENGAEGIRLSATCNEVSMFANRFFCNAQSTGSVGIDGDTGFNNGILPGTAVLTNGMLAGTAIPAARIDLFSGTQNCITCEGTNLLQTVFTDNLGNWQATISQPGPSLMFMATDLATNSSSAFSACITNTVSTNQLTSTFELYPNPFNEGFMLNAEAKQYRLIDMFGRIVLQGEIVSESQWINTEFISSGIYFLELDQQEIERKRVVKIK
jgi:parallel beta-helix repeat protein